MIPPATSVVMNGSMDIPFFLRSINTGNDPGISMTENRINEIDKTAFNNIVF